MEISNKQKVIDLLKSLETGNPRSLGYINPDKYIQHNPLIPDKLSGLGKALGEWAKQGIILKYSSTIHKVLGEGNFVLAVSEGQLAGKHNAFLDLFRVENGKIAEHWDVIEEIPPEENWKNKNGKF
jgi:predicted SnoaL-like aldol condensation-catalyzing enzyme